MPSRRKQPAAAARGLRRAAQPALLERKQQLVRGAIRDAALDLFLEKGFEAVRVEDITARAGVSRRTFFRYFASKDDLMAQGVDEFREVVRQAVASCPPGRPVMELFRQTVMQAARESASDPRARDVLRIMFTSPAARAAQLSRVPAVEDLLEEAFRRRCEGSPAREAAAGALARMTLSAVGAVMRMWYEDGKADITAVSQAVLDAFAQLLSGGGAGRAAAPRKFV